MQVMTSNRTSVSKLLIVFQVVVLFGLGFLQDNAAVHVSVMHSSLSQHHHHSIASTHVHQSSESGPTKSGLPDDHSHHHHLTLGLTASSLPSAWPAYQAGHESADLTMPEGLLATSLYRPPRSHSSI